MQNIKWKWFTGNAVGFGLKGKLNLKWRGRNLEWATQAENTIASQRQRREVESHRFILVFFAVNAHQNWWFVFLFVVNFHIRNKNKINGEFGLWMFFKGLINTNLNFSQSFLLPTVQGWAASQQVLLDLHFTKNTSHLLEGNPGSSRAAGSARPAASQPPQTPSCNSGNHYRVISKQTLDWFIHFLFYKTAKMAKK